jgi:hypothetical protein
MILQKAATSAPFDARVHAQLGYCYAHLQQRTAASSELTMAESYNAEKEPLVEDLLAECYQLLGDTLKAIDHYKTFLGSADAVGAQGEQFRSTRQALTNVEMSLTPHPVTIKTLLDFSQDELDNVLKSNLSHTELALVVNPLACSSGMARWARELVGDAGNDLEKAKRLFVGLARRINTGESVNRRTAIEAYRDWPDAKAKFMCQDYTLLYVSLARSLGLKAYYVLVGQDHSGKFVGHACAAVLLTSQALLVDPGNGSVITNDTNDGNSLARRPYCAGRAFSSVAAGGVWRLGFCGRGMLVVKGRSKLLTQKISIALHR